MAVAFLAVLPWFLALSAHQSSTKMDTGLDMFLSQIAMVDWDGKSQFPSPDSQGSLANVEEEYVKFPLSDFDAEFEAIFSTFIAPKSDDILDFPCGLDAPFIHEDLLYQGPVTQLIQPVNQLSVDENTIGCSTPLSWLNEPVWKDTFAALFTCNDLPPQTECNPTYVAFPVVGQDISISLAGILSDEDQTLEQIKAYLINYAESGMEVDPVPPALSVPSVSGFVVPADPAPVIIPVRVTTIEPKQTRRAVTPRPTTPRTRKPPVYKPKKPRPSKKMTERKRKQNKTAATRYRSKKRRQEDEAMEVHQALLQDKDKLVAIKAELKMKIEYAIRLMEGKLKKARS